MEANNLHSKGIHFHGLRHTYSNMLFEANENPKVIQALLGHKSVKTTITTYNSVDKSYFKKATDMFNKQYDTENNKKEKSAEQKVIDSFDDEQLDKLLELLEKRKAETEYEEEREKRKRKREQKAEM